MLVALCVVCLTSCVVGFAPYVGFAFYPCVVGFTPCGWTTSGWLLGAEGVAVIPCGWVAPPCRHQECCVRFRFVVFMRPWGRCQPDGSALMLLCAASPPRSCCGKVVAARATAIARHSPRDFFAFLPLLESTHRNRSSTCKKSSPSK